MRKQYSPQDELPLGFGMALAQSPVAMEQFAALPDAEKQRILKGARNARSKQEMQAYVNEIGRSS